MRLLRGMAAVAVGAAVLPFGTSLAQTSPDVALTSNPAELLQRLEEAEQRLRTLERKLETQAESAATAAAAAPQVRATGTRFSIGTSDGSSFVRLRGMVHVDGRHFEGEGSPATSNTWLLRRARPIVEGTVADIYDFRIAPDFGGGRSVIQDAFITARFQPWAAVTVGKFKVPTGLERVQSAESLRFIERGLPSAFLPNRDLGVQVGGEVGAGLFAYSVSYTNGVVDGKSTEGNATPDVENDAKGDFSGRVFFQPFLTSDAAALRGLGFGIGGTYVDSTGSASNTLLPSYRTSGQETFFSYRSTTAASGNTPAVSGTYADGERLRLSPQFYYSFRNVGVLGEYSTVSQDVSRSVGAETRSDTLDHTAWQLQLAWLVTGEAQTFRTPKPANPFRVGQPGRGAWEVVARLHELSIDEDAFKGGAASFANPATAARRAKAAGVAVNWYLNQNVKWQLDYELTHFDGGALAGNRPDEKYYFTRIALSY